VAALKVVALLPFKDEEWILPAYVSSVAPVVDEIVAIDDGSTDRSRRLIEEAGGYVVDNSSGSIASGGFLPIREQLLALGRERGGTHFIGLDADEALTTPSRRHLRQALSQLEPGGKIAMQWVTLWKRPDTYRHDGSVWTNLFKDFAWADSDQGLHGGDFMGIARTPGDNSAECWKRVPPAQAAVLHYQFAAWDRAQLKQAWYRCSELIRTPDRAFDINRMYAHGLDDRAARTLPVPEEWSQGIIVPADIARSVPGWQLDQILAWFDDRGIEFFEGLQIWHVPELHAEFVRRLGREPVPIVRISVYERLRRAWAHRFASRS
jgi:glycosyltransferase involved in cell wall biosynthesis